MRLNLSGACHLNPVLWETAERRLSNNIRRSTWAYPIFLTVLTVGTNLASKLPALLAGIVADYGDHHYLPLLLQ